MTNKKGNGNGNGNGNRSSYATGDTLTFAPLELGAKDVEEAVGAGA
jgi:hypothetical protein